MTQLSFFLFLLFFMQISTLLQLCSFVTFVFLMKSFPFYLNSSKMVFPFRFFFFSLQSKKERKDSKLILHVWHVCMRLILHILPVEYLDHSTIDFYHSNHHHHHQINASHFVLITISRARIIWIVGWMTWSGKPQTCVFGLISKFWVYLSLECLFASLLSLLLLFWLWC